MQRFIQLSVVVIGLLATAGLAAAEEFFITASLVASRQVIRFDTSAPGIQLNAAPVSGLLPLEEIVGIDVRPATGALYAVGNNNGVSSTVYILNRLTGATTNVMSISPLLAGGQFGVDFNPVADRLRIVSDAQQNLRLNVGTPATFVDGTINPASNLGAAAYTNNFVGAASTQLFDIDYISDRLFLQNPPNSGTLVDVGALGVNILANSHFDISGTSGTAYGLFETGLGSSGYQLYTVNLATGAATLVGDLGLAPGTVVTGFSLTSVPEPATLLLGGVGLAGAAFGTRRHLKRRRVKATTKK